jgi:membrane fusion protein (multidrug efflux system)
MTIKLNYMQRIVNISFAAVFMMALASCGGSSGKEATGDLKDKKTQLQKLKTDQEKLGNDIKKLEQELAVLDPSTVAKPKLVAVTTLATQNFTHFIDLQGRITTNNIFYVTPRGAGGQVKALYVKQGDNVKKGQLLLKMDDAITQQTLKQQEVQLSYLKDLYKRQKNLWDQGIGTEVQFITAKNNVEGLEKQMAITNEQLTTSNVYAEVSGVAETVTIHVGEFFTGAPTAAISIVSTGDLKAVVDVPENYLSRVKQGAQVVVEIPEVNKKFNTSISLISQVINANSRGFMAEAKIPGNANIKPNQLALVKIQDYAAPNVIVVPLTSLQSDDKGKYVYVQADENGKKVARKKVIVPGEVYGDNIEIKQGLTAGDKLITDGFQSLYDGQLITTS